MSKEDVMDYVMTTPGNPNRAVLSGMLDSIANASGSLVIRPTGVVEDNKVMTDTTWQQAYDALANGNRVIVMRVLQNGGIQQIIITSAILGNEEEELTYEIYNERQDLYFYANTANDYLYATE